ncbi:MULTISPECIES: NAD(P)/FAD-dependent oxidoreductase [Brucella/Ochrobactrum group]|uniref:FAD-binding oxidoreductase n=1 Tax=Brucella pseudintermedia TaxID=370111 RepID=A0ABY5UHQ7_9HYPH|nr:MULTISPECIES: FAD-binding oxidoreductase [Brucella/Ochrobactrum group]KAB2684500.1 FAD-binding oxidoreductase [Brucella pseudintermedia]MCO7727842.1 FAD-binding oxidoreductase [Brucella intermedia]NKE74806.1 FAD-binding oxidoreductase [Ochrobactrum sp. MC-1LL]TWG97737.1 D-amino-acid dehydrogenase [Ochrobactrum sp. J50]UWL62227.1 FAD-binding oxidoreductase [Brucella pseudintermedia]
MPIQQQDVIVLGAGIVGVSTALHLQARGRSVCLIDKSEPGNGTSFGNAGLIERSSVIPYSFPQGFWTLVRYGMNRRSDVRYNAFYILKMAGWLFQYWRESSPERLKVATDAMLPLIEASVREHDALVAQSGSEKLIRSQGWIEVFRTSSAFDAAVRRLPDLQRFKLSYDILDETALRARETSLGDVAGGIHWLDPKTVVNPGGVVKAYADLFVRNGGVFLHGDAATLAPEAGGWQVTTENGIVQARDAVVALGPQSGLVFRKFGYPIPLGIKRGHHLHFTMKDGLRLGHTVVDEEAGYVLAPMVQGVRLSTGIEFASPNAPANFIQLRKAEKIARKLVPQLGEAVETTPWLGLRPCLPDMRPVIGAAPKHKGLWFNFGHAHHGLTLGPATGRLLAEMLVGEEPFVDPKPYSAERFL